MKIAAVITAGGSGLRMQASVPKQFIPVHGTTILEKTIAIFQQAPMIDEIIVVLPEAHFEQISHAQIKTAIGGSTRQASVYHGLQKCSADIDVVVVHDGVRCMLSQADLANVIQACQPPFDGAVLAHPVRDTIKQVQGDTIVKTISRENVWAMQTPQVFFYAKLKQAYEKAQHENLQSTDDAQVMEYAGGKIKVVQGLATNIKVTYPEDLAMITEQEKA
ncbi:MAG: 2-C-methyl-D-erythritol 4-phosphate cytidylyltransferase [Bdellovibrionota bacterium]